MLSDNISFILYAVILDTNPWIHDGIFEDYPSLNLWFLCIKLFEKSINTLPHVYMNNK